MDTITPNVGNMQWRDEANGQEVYNLQFSSVQMSSRYLW